MLEEVVILNGALGHTLGVALRLLQGLLGVGGLLGTPLDLLGLESILLMLCCLIIVGSVI